VKNIKVFLIVSVGLLVLPFFVTCCFAGTTDITVNPSVTYQTWKYWMCAGPNYPGAISTDPSWLAIKTNVIDQLVNQLGCNTLNMTVQSGTMEQTQNYFSQWIAGALSNAALDAIRYAPVNDNSNPDVFACDPGVQACPTVFPMDQIDYQIDNFWDGAGGMRAAIIARGDAPYLVMTFVHWPVRADFIDSTPAEIGELFLAAFRHMNVRYGYVPDVIDIQVEPDAHCDPTIQITDCKVRGAWDYIKIANSLTAVKARLSAAGFSPILQCCSTIDASDAAPGWYTQATAITGQGVIGLLSTHLYGGYTYNQASNANLASIATQAAADGIPTVMSEFDIAGVSDGMAAMTQMNATGFLKYGSISIGNNISSSDYLKVTSSSPYTGVYVTGSETSLRSDEPAWFYPQLMNYVRPGAIRESGSSSDSSWVVAFRRNSADVVVSRLTTTGTQSVNVTGVSAGTYSCTYTFSNSVLLQPCGPAQTIGSGGTLTATLSAIPSATMGVTTAVLTFSGTPAVTSSVSVVVGPSITGVAPSGVSQFYAAVTGSDNTSVSWSISPQVGAISVLGVYTAPASVPFRQHVIVTAVSAADATAKGTATVDLINGTSVTVAPSAVSLGAGQQQQYVADFGGTVASGVTWSIAPQLGSISASGLFTAPSSIPPAQTVTVTATIGAGVTASALVSLDSSASSAGLVVYLPFDEASGIIAHDASGNGANGTLKCNAGCLPIPDWTAGIVRGALNFSNAGDFVSIPDSASLELTNQFTFAFWAWVPANSSNITYVQKVWGTDVGQGTEPSNGYLISTGSPANYMYINLYNDNARVARCSTAPGVVQSQMWQHFAITYDNAAIIIYVNGIENVECSATGSAGTDGTPVSIGGINRLSPGGTIDELRIYNRALSPQEIAGVYQAF
jgi:hypothetical protein